MNFRRNLLRNALIGIRMGNTAIIAQRSWKPIPVQILSDIPNGAIDSIVTVRSLDSAKIQIIYAFNNPCTDSLRASVKQDDRIVSVRFSFPSALRRHQHNGLGDLSCPAAIVNEAYSEMCRKGNISSAPIEAMANTGGFLKSGKS